MLLGGLWHGPAWTFVAWGGLHGLYLVVNHAWRAYSARMKIRVAAARVGLFRTITFVTLVFSWVLFRAADFSSAVSIMTSMAGLNGLSLGKGLAKHIGDSVTTFADYGIFFNGMFSNGILPDRDFALAWMVILIIFVMKAPTTHEIFPNSALESGNDPTFGTGRTTRLVWNSQLTWGLGIGLMVFLSLQQFFHISPFLYFQF